MKNALFVIAPYRHSGMWVFDDPDVGLVKEPFVSGIDIIIDRVVAAQKIPDAENGFTAIFSANPFPGYNVKLEWRRTEHGGNWYFCQELGIEGWLCPALFRYFENAPMELYAKAEPRKA